ncbi:hypothetical protein DOTSEDRAFT_71602 [Dothistroma septosporum NZE10]|uniref:F-box domain-containing protein n=1 Tax=Dothistroma septosporum (strain NZE10 / CBS 128990) TaxID=675120 RepID=N1PJY1_DOTSN|nr:hypothetical protein DOTSEDRAFT_71602 [Dothistroma septosporum NZE10]
MSAPTLNQRGGSERVFDLPELLEPILLNVDDAQTILLSQRVNHSFNNIVNRSHGLQRVLWMKATPQADQPADFPRINPLLTKHHTAINIPTLTTSIDAQNRTDMLGRYKYLEVRVIAKDDNSSWMRMLPFQPKRSANLALACPFVCETCEDREKPEKWRWKEEQDELWLDREDCEEYVGREVFITKCTKLGKVEAMTIREMFEMAGEEGLRERVARQELEDRVAELEVEDREDDD